jgi:hypothetical protein
MIADFIAGGDIVTTGPSRSAFWPRSARSPRRVRGLLRRALALARLKDDPKAVNQRAAAAKVLAGCSTSCVRRPAWPSWEPVGGQIDDHEFTVGLGLHFRNVFGDAICAKRRFARRLSHVS